MKNMKIEINKDQPLDKVVRELEGLGYKCDGYHPYNCNWIYCVDDGTFAMYTIGFKGDCKLTTLAELKEMK